MADKPGQPQRDGCHREPLQNLPARGGFDLESREGVLASTANTSRTVSSSSTPTKSSGFVALSAHVTCPGEHNHDPILRAARTMLAERFGIRHTTIQIDRDPACEGTDHPPFRS